MYEIRRRFRFYGAHRNHLLADKCSRVHGHTYLVDFHLSFEDVGESGVCLPFHEIDNRIEPLIREMDHRFLIWEEDPFYLKLKGAGFSDQELRDELGLRVVAFPTSAEHLAFSFYQSARGLGLPVTSVRVSETPSSEVTYYE